MNIEGKNVLVTGGSKGLGKSIAKALIKKGAFVIITGRNKEELEASALEIGALPFCADVSKEEDVLRTFDLVKEKFESLHVLVNNAGLAKGNGPITEAELADFQYVFGVNVFGAAMMTKHAARLFKSQGHGNIINIASTSALKGYANGSIYAASKFALSGMTQCWRDELRPFNVRVTQINPTYIPTAFGTSDGIEKPLQANMVKPTDIAHAVVSVLEMDDAAFVTELTVFATNPF